MLRQISVNQFLDERDELPFGGRWAELVEGIPIVFEPPDPVHGNVILNVSKTLADYIHRTNLGYACFDLGLLLSRDPDTLRYPAVSYYVDGPRFAESDKLFTEATPAFVIELASSVDRRQLMLSREREYLSRGVQLVWTIDTEAREIQVAKVDVDDVRRFAGDDTVSGTPLLPDLDVRAADLFVEPSWWSGGSEGQKGKGA
jgi:Uma2 family endonuclease